jgi:hypothetical protein
MLQFKWCPSCRKQLEDTEITFGLEPETINYICQNCGLVSQWSRQ